MSYQLTIIFIISCTLFSFSQQERTIKRGQILEFQNPISGVHIYNLNTLQGTSTTDEGKFEVSIKINDTLIISHVKYQSLRIIVTEKYIKQEPLIINMHEITNYLDTVTIKNHNLTGNLNIDMQSIPKISNKDSIISDFQRLVKILIERDQIKIINGSIPVIIKSNPFGFPTLKATIGFDYKDLKLKREIKYKRNFQKKIITNFGVTYFSENLKIPSDKIYHFITYCEYRDIMQLYKNNEIMKVLTILQEESIEYLKIKN